MKKSGQLTGKRRTDISTFEMFIINKYNKTQIFIKLIISGLLDDFSKNVHWVPLSLSPFAENSLYLILLERQSIVPALLKCDLFSIIQEHPTRMFVKIGQSMINSVLTQASCLKKKMQYFNFQISVLHLPASWPKFAQNAHQCDCVALLI